ncbi:MAG: peptidylprolyl isomerase [Chloroflexi bacterium]|nr:peptidylprolyl isomerase [Chloroflexota bacterium]
MTKKNREKPARQPTRHQLSRWQQQERRRRIFLASGLFIIVAVLSVIGWGWYVNEYRPLHQVVLNVNGVKFNMDYYVRALKFYGAGVPAQSLTYLTNQVTRTIEQGELAKQAAVKLGISVSDREVDERLKAYKPPLSKDYRELARAQMVIDKLRDDYFDKMVPTVAEQRQVMAMFLESEGQAAEVRSRIEAGEDFGELAGKLSLDNFSKGRKGDLGWSPMGVLNDMLGSTVVEGHVFSAGLGAVSQPVPDQDKTKNVGYWLVEVLERKEEAEAVRVRVMLLSSAEQAEQVRARLEAGEDFAVLAKELSQHEASKDKGGDFGLVSAGTMPTLDEFLFDAPAQPGAISQPVRDEAEVTRGGYWLLKVVASEDNRKVDDEDRTLLETKLLRDWLTSLLDDEQNKVESFLDRAKTDWAVSRAVRELQPAGR